MILFNTQNALKVHSLVLLTQVIWEVNNHKNASDLF